MAPARRMTRSNREVYPIMFFINKPHSEHQKQSLERLLSCRSFKFVCGHWLVYGQQKVGSFLFEFRRQDRWRIHHFLLLDEVSLGVSPGSILIEQIVLQCSAALVKVVTILFLPLDASPLVLVIIDSIISVLSIEIGVLPCLSDILIQSFRFDA